MFTLIHNYHPRYTEGLLQNGFFEPGDGLKITQHYLTPEHMKFNQIAAKDGALYRLTKEMAGCFYVDRLQGGTFISHYDFDLALADEYDRITDGNFLGFQLHESGGTRALDWRRIQRQLKETNLPWNLENILYAVTLISHNKEFPHFSNGFPEEYAALTPPTTLSEYVADLRGMWHDRQKLLHGRLLNCDCTPMLCGLEKDVDVKRSFIEVGAQAGLIRQQLAQRRGISRAAKKKWGVYLEPWGQKNCTAYLFMRDKSNEWYIDGSTFLYQASDGNGGSSMSMARRVMYYALFGGADYFAEEWGQANTFYEWDTFELSPYGMMKRDFLRQARTFGEIRPYVPIAVVIPHEYILYSRGGYLPYPNDMVAEEHRDIHKKIHALLDDGRMIGSEDHVFECGGIGSLIDIIYDDTYADPTSEYDLIVDFSGRLHGDRIVDGNDSAAVQAAVGTIVGALPFALENTGGLDYQVFDCDESTYVALYNHKGVTKTAEQGEFRLAAADAAYSFKCRDGHMPTVVIPSDGAFDIAEGAVHGRLLGGDMIVFQCYPRR